jgi:putative transposase
MERRLRARFRPPHPGAVYHVMDRGDQCEAIFRDDQDRERFLKTLDEVCERTGWRSHACVPMRNHDHFMLETPSAYLVE